VEVNLPRVEKSNIMATTMKAQRWMYMSPDLGAVTISAAPMPLATPTLAPMPLATPTLAPMPLATPTLAPMTSSSFSTTNEQSQAQTALMSVVVFFIMTVILLCFAAYMNWFVHVLNFCATSFVVWRLINPLLYISSVQIEGMLTLCREMQRRRLRLSNNWI
jgi:hypothetical protein